MSSRPRKPAASFVNDAVISNLKQNTPRNDYYYSERSPFTMTNHNSKTNFIGETILSEGPRAVAVSETGEKHSLNLSEEINKPQQHGKKNHPSFIAPAPNVKQNTTSKEVPEVKIVDVSERESTDDANKSCAKRGKGSPTNRRAVYNLSSEADLMLLRQAARRCVSQKPRPVFTPRHPSIMTPNGEAMDGSGETYEPTNVGDRKWEMIESRGPHGKYITRLKDPGVERRPKVLRIMDAQTQTDASPPKCTRHCQALVPVTYTKQPQPRNLEHITPRRKGKCESVGDMLEMPRRDTSRSVSSKRTKKKSISEIRSIASALVLITVVSWLFASFFGMSSILDLVTDIIQYIARWFTQKRPPKTYVQRFADYLYSYWS